MHKTERIEKLIELCLVSGYVKDDSAPLSVMLIANPESAKTKMIQMFECPHTIETGDLSGKMIVDKIIPELENNRLHHILIPDFIKVMAHKDTTVKATVAFLNGLIEEGVKQQLFFGQSFALSERRKCGLITSCTPNFYYKMFRYFHDIGFNTRFIPISFIYSNDTILEIHKAISNNELFDEIIKMKKIARKEIIIPDDIATKISNEVIVIMHNQKHDSMRIRVVGGKQSSIPIEMYGFRLHKQLRKLVQSIALLDGQKIVKAEHLQELFSLMDYIRLPKNPKVI